MTPRLSTVIESDVVVVAQGGQTSLGRSVLKSAIGVRAGMSNVMEHPWIVDSQFQPARTARANWLDDGLTIDERMTSLAMAAAAEAMAEFDQSLPKSLRMDSVRMVLFLGLPPERPGLNQKTSLRIGTELQNSVCLRNRLADIVYSCTGHASGLAALQHAQHEIVAGRIDIAIVGGVDSYMTYETIRWLEASDQLHSDENPWGFIPGEAAGFLVIASTRFCREKGIAPLAQIAAIHSAHETNRIKSDSVCIAEGLTLTYRTVLESLPEDLKVDQLICDLNGEPYRADELGFTLLRTSKHFRDPGTFIAPADCWGDVGAASGPLFISLAIAAGQGGYSKGPLTLVSAGSEDGSRSATIVVTNNLQPEVPTCR